jgi:putative flippase GtrA
MSAVAYFDDRIHRQLGRFLLVGVVGFGVDVGVMAALLYVFGLGATESGLILCRTVAWAAAIVVAFVLNAKVTFGASIKHSRFLNYLFIQGVGAAINLGSYSALIFGPLRDYPLVALMIGSALGTINNFLLVRKFVYRFHPSLDDPDE